jgi:hypothetical protein
VTDSVSAFRFLVANDVRLCHLWAQLVRLPSVQGWSRCLDHRRVGHDEYGVEPRCFRENVHCC